MRHRLLKWDKLLFLYLRFNFFQEKLKYKIKKTWQIKNFGYNISWYNIYFYILYIINMVGIDKRESVGGKSNSRVSDIIATTQKALFPGWTESKEAKESKWDIFMNKFYNLAKDFEPVLDGNGNKIVYFEIEENGWIVEKITFFDKRRCVIRTPNWTNSPYADFLSKFMFERKNESEFYQSYEWPMQDRGRKYEEIRKAWMNWLIENTGAKPEDFWKIDRYVLARSWAWPISSNDSFYEEERRLSQIEKQIKQARAEQKFRNISLEKDLFGILSDTEKK